MSTPRTIRLAPDDNVVIAVDQIAPGAVIAGHTASERVPRGHKMAVAAILATLSRAMDGSITAAALFN